MNPYRQYLICLLIVCCLWRLAQGYPTGAPLSGCCGMTPGHDNTKPQTTPSPFSISVSKSSYRPGMSLTVTLRAPEGRTFVGFLLQARRADPSLDTVTLIGSFNNNFPQLSKYAPCGTNSLDDIGIFQQTAMTHSKSEAKTSVSFKWNAPINYEGHIVFRCTFAETKHKYWVAVNSPIVMDESITTPLTFTAQQIAKHPPCQRKIEPTTPTTMSTLMPSISRNPECYKTLGCLDDCDSRGENCAFMLSWKREKDTMTYILQSWMPNSDYWMGVGFSVDQRMQGADVLECVRFSNQAQVFSSQNSPYARINTRNTVSNFSKTEYIKIVNGVMSCRLRCTIDITLMYEKSNFSKTEYIEIVNGVMSCTVYDWFTPKYEKEWYLFLAKGPARPDSTLLKHDTKFISRQKVDLANIAVKNSVLGDVTTAEPPDSTTPPPAPTPSGGPTNASVNLTESTTDSQSGPTNSTIKPPVKTDSTSPTTEKTTDKSTENTTETTEATIEPTGAPISTGKLVRHKDCNKTRGCFDDDCDADNDDCKITASWTYKGNNSLRITLSIRAKTGDVWVAVGFSPNQKMGDTSVIECVRYGTDVAVFTSYNKPNAWSNRHTDSDGAVNLVESSSDDGIFECTVAMAPHDTSKSKMVDLDKKWYIILAHGKAHNDGRKQKHSLTLVSKEPISLKIAGVTTGEKKGDKLVKAHACLMLAAWIFISSVGIYIARYYKHIWPEATLCNTGLWFSLHVACMILTFLTTIAGFCIIFIDVGGYSEIGADSRLVAAHPIVGIVVTALVVINPIMGAFRCKPTGKNRWVFNWFHWLVGKAAWILANFAIFAAFHIKRAQMEEEAKYIWYAYLAYQGVAVITQEILRCCDKRHLSRENAYTFENKTTEDWYDNQHTQPIKPSSVLLSTGRSVLLAIHIIMVSAFLTALLILVIWNEEKDLFGRRTPQVM